jgi:UDP-N-acetylglucosamine 2-epimerase (non-hydrolysing)
MKIISVVGARPNFMKIAALQKYIPCKLVHTGQHYDYLMSQAFFEDLELPPPDYNLNIGSASHAIQTAKAMIAFEDVLVREEPDLVLVVGDVNSSLACALTARKFGTKVAHVEAGCRSFYLAMPEETNRIVTDAVSDYLFAIDQDSVDNLRNEGKTDNVYLVGDTMIDAVRAIPQDFGILEKFSLEKQGYCVVTLHRPQNVDNKDSLEQCLEILREVQTKIKIIFPIHPRTKAKLNSSLEDALIDPLRYRDFVNLVRNSKFVITDSGSLQAETTYLGVPCLTMRDNTERPNTLVQGTNRLVGRSKEKVREAVGQILSGSFQIRNEIPFYDGLASKRIADIIRVLLNTV